MKLNVHALIGQQLDMAKGPEGKYIDKVNRQVDKLLSPNGFHFSNTNPYVGGIPDQYYEDNHSCYWIEYKAINKLPKVLDLTKPGMLSALQRKWLRRSQANHGNCAVIVGLPNGDGIWFQDLSWEVQHSSTTLKFLTPTQVALKIVKRILK